MPHFKTLNQRRAAGSAEHEDALVCAQRDEVLTAKIHACQKGLGEAPTVEEFQQGRKVVERTVALRRLQGGVSET